MIDDDEARRTVNDINSILGANGDLKDHLRRLRSLQEIGTAQEFHEFAKSIHLDEVKARNAAIASMVESQKRIAWIFSLVKTAALWASAVAAGWLAVQSIINGLGQ